MKRLFTLIFLFVFSITHAQTGSFQNNSEGLEPLGYSDESKHFIEVKNKTAIYDLKKRQVIHILDGVYLSENVLFDKYMLLRPMFDFGEDKDYTLLNLETGNYNDEKMVSIKKGGNHIYSYSTDLRTNYKLGEDDEWEETDTYPSHESVINGWSIQFGKLEYKDYIINKEDKSIILNGNAASYFQSCGPYLVFAKETNTLIDTNGTVVNIDPELIKDDLKCYFYLNRIDFFDDVVAEVFSGEEYKGAKRFKLKNRTYFESENGDWKYKDEKGNYFNLDYTDMYSKIKSCLFGTLDGKYYYISTDDHTPIFELSRKFPHIVNKRYMWLKDQHKLYDTEGEKHLIPDGSEGSYCSSFGFGYSQGENWNLASYDNNKSVSLKGDKINYITEEYIAITLGNQVNFYNWKGDEIDSVPSEGIDVIGENLVHSSSSIGQNILKEIGGEALDFPNYNTAWEKQGGFMFVNYLDVNVYDEEKALLYTIDNYKRHSKTGIYRYVKSEIEFYDFDGKKKVADPDIFEQMKFDRNLSSKEEMVLAAKKKIKLLDSFLLSHPSDLDAIEKRVEMGMAYLGSQIDLAFEGFLLKLNKKYPDHTDIKMLALLVKGISDPSYRKTSIVEVEKILNNPNRISDKHLVADHDGHFYGVIQYHLGYVHHLAGNTQISKDYKTEAFSKFESSGFAREFLDKIYTLY